MRRSGFVRRSGCLRRRLLLLLHLLGLLGLLRLVLLLVGAVVADGTAGSGAQGAVLAGHVAGDTADGGALEAALGLGHRGQCDTSEQGGGDQGGLHGCLSLRFGMEPPWSDALSAR